MTKHTDSSRSTDSASGITEETMASEIRAKEWLAANWRKFVPNSTEMHGSGHFAGSEVKSLLAAYSEGLASRVEELEKLIAKQSGCSRCNDSASGGIDK